MGSMSTLIANAYPDEATAKRSLAKLGELQQQQLVVVDDAVIARHDGDKIKLDQAVGLAGAGAGGILVFFALLAWFDRRPVHRIASDRS